MSRWAEPVPQWPPPRADGGEARPVLVDPNQIFRFRQTNGYYAKFAPIGAQLTRQAYSYPSAVMPGIAQTVAIGAFKVPEQMMLQIRDCSFAANRSAGGIEVPVVEGQLRQYLAFGILDNGAQIGVVGFDSPAPVILPGGGTAVLAPDYQFLPPGAAAAVPPMLFPTAHQGGVGKAMADDHAYYIQSGHTLAFIASVNAALPYAITSMSVLFDGMIMAAEVFARRLEYEGR